MAVGITIRIARSEQEKSKRVKERKVGLKTKGLVKSLNSNLQRTAGYKQYIRIDPGLHSGPSRP